MAEREEIAAHNTISMRTRLLGPVVAVTLFLVAALGSFAVWWYWPVRESESAKAQAIAALLGFLSSVLIASITWIYVRTTQEMLALQRQQQEAHRPKITIASDWASFVINGPIDNHQSIQYIASWRAYFSNRSLTTSTTVRILRAVLIDVPQQTFIRAYFQDANNANATNIRRLEPGETSTLLLVAEFKVPNLNDAQPPEPARFKFELSDIFTGNLATPELQANVH